MFVHSHLLSDEDSTEVTKPVAFLPVFYIYLFTKTVVFIPVWSGLISRKLQNLTYIFDWLYFTQCLTSFFSIDNILCLCAWFFILFRLTDEVFWIITSPNVFVYLETLTSIIRTGLPTLVELIDLVSPVIIFQTTFLRRLTFLSHPRLWFSQSWSFGFLSSF